MNVANHVSTLLCLFLLGGVRWRLASIAAAEQPKGTTVYLPRECNDLDGFNNRTVVLNMLKNGRLEINSTPFSHEALASKMAEIFATRQERVLRLVADRQASYGDVMAAIDLIKAHVPHLVILPVIGSSTDAAMGACISSKDIRPEDL